ncbi:energy-coupling factor transporter transmembrane component T [Planococcus sp. ISL-109]|uniref:energy-coupling factor transporter transmembrane component T family protein n=1 Tax=Planococcus sp. ISL-109 TaxID=2819166 RepID=UPI001BE7CED3|nr:energy-coupling factor transporter transmembrane component T [Planococcus sp. ISL-109]MBT2582144.1 energy-coupling factor transporter transmembrane protein EcfT [Planococcus sp. ISL-109]
MRQILHNMNPSMKFLAVTVSMLVLAFFFNPWTPLLFFLSVIALQLLFSRINWKLWLLFMLPFFFGAFGYLWTTLVFGADTGGPILWSYGPIEITEQNWAHAWSLSLRVLAFSSLSLLFALTTDPVRFIQSLMQQWKLSPKLAYSLMVSYQFLPVLKAELEQIQQAHRLRGAEIDKHWWNRLLAMRRLFIPLLAGAVRKAERAAFAMEARGFTGEPRTAFYEQLTITRMDYVLTALFGIVLALCCSIEFLDF